MVRFHADHDEHLRVTEDEMKYPMLGACLYLDEDTNPTIFFNTQQTSKYEKQIEPFPPTDAVFSYADRGKFLVYDPTYIHGILPVVTNKLLYGTMFGAINQIILKELECLVH